MKRAAPDGTVTATLDRAGLWAMQTPQGFRAELLVDAYRRAVAEDWPATDDAAIVERAGHRVRLVEGEAVNFKITHPEDRSVGRLAVPVPLSGTPQEPDR